MTLLTAACQTPLPRDSPGKNTGAGCHALLQGIFPDPGVEPASPAAPEFLSICLPLSCQGSPYTHHYIKKTSNNKLPFRTRNPTQYSVMASMEKNLKKELMYAYMYQPHTCQRCSKHSNKTLCAPGPRDPTETEPDLPLSVCVSLEAAWISTGLLQGQGLWLQQTWEV